MQFDSARDEEGNRNILLEKNCGAFFEEIGRHTECERFRLVKWADVEWIGAGAGEENG